MEHGADVAPRRKGGTTPLYLASERGHMGLAWLLIVHGVDTAVRRKDEVPPLRLASRYVDLAQFLRSHQAWLRGGSNAEDSGAKNQI